jgi:tRNA (guanine37-N1)-methyltransferase
MRIDMVSVVPELLNGFLQSSIVSRAIKKGLVDIQIVCLRDYAVNAYGQVDDYPYGGGAGMVIMAEPLSKCIENLQSQRTYQQIIYMTPDGQKTTQKIVNTLSLHQHIMIICGHYKGIDQRVRDLYVTMELSIGDFVVTGGEIPAALVTDAIVRLIPGVLGNEESALTDTFQDGLLSPPVYTRPETFKGLKVPEVLLSGNHTLIQEWRLEQAMSLTQQKRPDLFNET